MTEDYTALLGRRVKHSCNDPNCNLEGVVISVQYFKGKTVAGEQCDCWVLVQWDKGVHGVVTSYIPAHKVKPVEMSV